MTVAAPPYILIHPVSQMVAQGQDATFTASATNDCGSALIYQWRWNGDEIAGATDSAYTLTNAQCADAGSFELVVAMLAGSQTSSVASLTVVAPPVMLSGRADQTVSLGQEVTFAVTATNDCGNQLTYQWRFNGTEILDATAKDYVFTTLQVSNSGNYAVVVANLAAAVTSPATFLTIAGPYLTVYPAEPSEAGTGMTNFNFVFPSVAGIEYAVQYKDTRSDTNDWLPLMTNSGTGGFITNDFPITTDSPGRFYRMLV